MEALEFFLAAVQAVAPEALERVPPAPTAASGAQLLEWVVHNDPAAASVFERLTERERADIRHVLDGMLRERQTQVRPPRRR